MGALKNLMIDRGDPEVPYPVSLYDPPVGPSRDYGDEDAPKREGLSFVEWLTAEAHNFRILGTAAGKYLAGVIEAKARLCEEHGVHNPIELMRLEARQADRCGEHVARLLGRAERAEAELARRNP